MSLLDALLLDPAPFNIWLAVRTDGIKGTGTASDPFDGGTAAAFDARLKEIGALFPTEKVAIHLGPGTFYTQGYADADAANSWQVKGGMSIRGSGIGVTTLKRANGAPGNRLNYVVGHSLDTPADFFEISDLTIDCNLSAADADAACGALRVMGNHARIRRVRAIDWGSRTDAVPGFVFALVLAYPPSQAGVRNAGLEDCIADAPWPAGTVTGTPTVKVFHAGSLEQPTAAEDYGIGPFIRNCYVRSSPAPAAVIFHGLSMDWCLGGVVEGNQIHDTTFGGPVLEQTSARDIIVRNNTYKNVQGGPRWDLGTLVPAEGLPLLDLAQTQAGSGIALATMDGVEHGLKKGDRVLVEPDEGFPVHPGSVCLER